MTQVAQLVGYLVALSGAFLLLGPWALVGGGLILLIVPEIVEGVRSRGTTADTVRRPVGRGPR